MQYEELKALVDYGYSQVQIIRLTGNSKSVVRYYLLKYNLECKRKPKVVPPPPKPRCDYKQRELKNLGGSLCGHCGNAYIARCEKIRTGKPIYGEHTIKKLSGMDTVIVRQCDHYIHDDEIERHKFYENLNTDIIYHDVTNGRKPARGSNIRRR